MWKEKLFLMYVVFHISQKLCHHMHVCQCGIPDMGLGYIISKFQHKMHVCLCVMQDTGLSFCQQVLTQSLIQWIMLVLGATYAVNKFKCKVKYRAHVCQCERKPFSFICCSWYFTKVVSSYACLSMWNTRYGSWVYY